MRLTLFKTKDCILNSLFKCKSDFVCKVFEISSCVLKSTVFLSLSLVGIQYSNIQCCKNISIWANLLACFSCVKRRRKYSFILNFKTKHMVTPRNISNQAVFKLIKLSTHTSASKRMRSPPIYTFQIQLVFNWWALWVAW